MIKETHRWPIKSFAFKSSAHPGWRHWWRNFSLIAWYVSVSSALYYYCNFFRPQIALALLARAILLVFEKFTRAYLFQIALEIMWLPILIMHQKSWIMSELCKLHNIVQYFWVKNLSKTSRFVKHLTIKNCNKTFVKTY